MSLERRSRAAMRDLQARMRALAAEGKSRKEIGLALGCTPAQVTKGLGPERVWRDRRAGADECSTMNVKAKAAG